MRLPSGTTGPASAFRAAWPHPAGALLDEQSSRTRGDYDYDTVPPVSTPRVGQVAEILQAVLDASGHADVRRERIGSDRPSHGPPGRRLQKARPRTFRSGASGACHEFDEEDGQAL